MWKSADIRVNNIFIFYFKKARIIYFQKLIYIEHIFKLKNKKIIAIRRKLYLSLTLDTEFRVYVIAVFRNTANKFNIVVRISCLKFCKSRKLNISIGNAI